MVSEQLQFEDEEVPITLRRAWDRALRTLALRVTKPTFEAHIRSLRPVALTEETQGQVSIFHVTLGVPSPFTREWVENRHGGLIINILEEILDGRVTLKFSLLPKKTPGSQAGLFDAPTPVKPAPKPVEAPVVPEAKASTPDMFDFEETPASTPAPKTPLPTLSGPVEPVSRPLPPPQPAPVQTTPNVTPAFPATTTSRTPAPRRDSQADAPLISARYTFDNFVVGASNRLAHAGAQAVAQAPGRVYNPLFLYGPPGMGKTHLMHAIANEFVSQGNDPTRIAYLSGEAFTTQFVASLRDKKAEEFRRRWRSVDLWLVDDIQFIAGKERTKEEFFHTFNAMYQSGKQIVICSDRSPRELQAMDERLCSRFECGLIADICPPDLETRLAILHSKADLEGMRIPDDVLLYMARLVQSNIRTLEGALVKLVAYASLVNSPVTEQLAANILERYYIVSGGNLDRRPESPAPPSAPALPAPQSGFGGYSGTSSSSGNSRTNGYTGNFNDGIASHVTPEIVQRVVAKRFGLHPDILSGKRRDREAVQARQIAMHLLRELTEISLPGIGQLFGRDHSTVMHSCDKVKGQIPTDHDLRSLVEDLIIQIRAQTTGN